MVNGESDSHLNLIAPPWVQAHLLPSLLDINLQYLVIILANRHRADRDDRVLNGDEEIIVDGKLRQFRDVQTWT